MTAIKYYNRETDQWEFVANGEATTDPREVEGSKPARVWIDPEADSPAGGGGGDTTITHSQMFLATTNHWIEVLAVGEEPRDFQAVGSLSFSSAQVPIPWWTISDPLKLLDTTTMDQGYITLRALGFWMILVTLDTMPIGVPDKPVRVDLYLGLPDPVGMSFVASASGPAAVAFSQEVVSTGHTMYVPSEAIYSVVDPEEGEYTVAPTVAFGASYTGTNAGSWSVNVSVKLQLAQVQ